MSEILRDLLVRFDAVRVGSKYTARCPLCQPHEEHRSEYKLLIAPGAKLPVYLYCYRCCEKGNRKLNGRVVRECLRAVGLEPGVYFEGATPEQISELWKGVGLSEKPRESELPADPDLLHEVYSDLLSELDLVPRHERWLRKRGLGPDWAFGAGYRSTPTEPGPIAKRLFDKWGFRLGVVPGFSSVFSDQHTKLLTRQQAVLIPCRDIYGRTLALKQRLLDGGRGRMRLLSGGSSKPVVLCHVPLGVGGHRWGELWVTEGERKADVCFQRGAKACVGIPGVSTWPTALPLIDQLLSPGGTVVLALDRDGKRGTRKAHNSLGQQLVGKGIRVLTAEWEGVKGIDDAEVCGVKVGLSDWKDSGDAENDTFTPTPALHHTVSLSTAPLKDWEITPYIERHGPIARVDLPLRHSNQQVLISNWIREGKLRIQSKGPKGQVLVTNTGSTQ